MPREIHTLSGDLYQPPGASLAAARWTSTSGRWGARAPFGGRGGGVHGLGCACQKKQSGLAGCGCDMEGLGSVETQILRRDKPGQTPWLEVTAYVLSQGKLDPTRTLAAMVGSLQRLGYGVSAKPAVKTYPLTWIWRYDAPNQVYQASVTEASGPFAGVYKDLGILTTGAPTMEDSAKLASFGTSVTLTKIALPPAADLSQPLGQLLDQLAVELKKAKSNSNVAGFQQTLLTVRSGRGTAEPDPENPPPDSGSGWGGLALLALGGLFLLSKKDKEQIRV